MVTHEPVWQMISERLEATVSLALTTIVFSILIAVPLGLFAARTPRRLDRPRHYAVLHGRLFAADIRGRLSAGLAVLHQAAEWLPAQGYVGIEQGVGAWLLHLIAPTVAMSTVFIVLIARITRAGAIETLNQDYIRTARAMGASEMRDLSPVSCCATPRCRSSPSSASASASCSPASWSPKPCSICRGSAG